MSGTIRFNNFVACHFYFPSYNLALFYLVLLGRLRPGMEVWFG